MTFMQGLGAAGLALVFIAMFVFTSRTIGFWENLIVWGGSALFTAAIVVFTGMMTGNIG